MAAIPLGRGAGRRKLSAIADLFLQGMPINKIAEELQLTTRTVYRYLREIKDDSVEMEPMRRMKQEAIPMAVENVIDGLAKGDKTYSIKTLEWTLFAPPAKHEPLSAPVNFALQVIVQQPPEGRGQTVDALVGNVAGIPRQINMKDEAIDAEQVTEAT